MPNLFRPSAYAEGRFVLQQNQTIGNSFLKNDAQEAEQMERNRNHRKVQRVTLMGLMAAISIVLVSLVHFPLLPAAAFLEYDPADIPIFITTFLLGPWAGLALTVIVSVIQGLTVSAAAGPIGIIMHILATGSFTLTAGFLYQKEKSRKQAVIALIVGVLTMTLVMVGCNLIFTPLFMGQPMKNVIRMLMPVIIPFNLLKGGINAVITYLVYKPVSHTAHKMLSK